MDIRSFLHKFRMGFTRMCEASIPYTTAAKRYGDWGEDELVHNIQSLLPNCEIKKNIIIQTSEGDAEIDCFILYKNKLFAIEVKHWKGRLSEEGIDFVQYKRDRWTDEIHTKYHKSPFKQLGRAIYLLRKQISENVWINSAVFFEGTDCIEINSDNVSFDDVDDLVSYIINDGKTSWGDANLFFDKCVTADYLYCDTWNKSLHCVICDESLRFNTPKGPISRCDIQSIAITHHWSYDELRIKTITGTYFISKVENASVYVIENGYKKRYALCKLDHIQIGS